MRINAAIAVLLFPVLIGAQEVEIENLSPELSLNISRLLENFISFNSGELQEDNASLIFFKTSKDGVNYFRLGLDIQAVSLSDDDVEQSNFLVGLKIGYERKKQLGQRWRAGLGADLLVEYSEGNQTVFDPFFGSTDFKEEVLRVGPELVFGIAYDLAKNVSLGTEGYFVMTYLQTKGSGIFSSSGTDTGYEISIVPPPSLYLSMRF